MKNTATIGAKALLLVALMASVSACGLPRSGPNKAEIFKGSVLEEGDAFIITVNSQVTRRHLGGAGTWLLLQLHQCGRGGV